MRSFFDKKWREKKENHFFLKAPPPPENYAIYEVKKNALLRVHRSSGYANAPQC